MSKEKIFRSYKIERDAEGMPIKLFWAGDYLIDSEPNRAEIERRKLAEWEEIYGGDTR